MSEENNAENEEPSKLPPIPPSKKAPPPPELAGTSSPRSKFGPGSSAPPFAARKSKALESVAEITPEPAEIEASPAPEPENMTVEEDDEVKRAKVQKKRSAPSTVAIFKTLLSCKAPFLLTVFVLLLPFVAISWFCYNQGVDHGKELGDETAAMGGLQLPPDISAALDQALVDLRKGDSKAAVRELKVIEKTPPGYPSVTYLIALAAMQDGDIALSEQKIKESISKRERISDSLGLQAVLETQKASDPTLAKLVDPRRRAELLLRQAIIADAANPYPHFELATLLRYRGQHDEALKEVYAAQARLNPVDSHTIMDLTSTIMELEDLPKDKLPVASPESDDIRKLFPAAYVAMKQGDYPSAVTILRKCRKLSSPDIFDYAINDPAIRHFSHQPEFAEFFREAP